MVEWDRTHRYCGRCGTPTRDKAGERAKECPACGYVAYPRVTPAMMVLVTRGRELLLARAPRFPPGMYSALAGFVEPGETIEDCIHREVREEVGIEVGDIRYFASQSWAFPHSLMIAYTAEYAGGELQPDAAEIAEAKWFAWDAVPRLPPSISISRRLIEATVARLGIGRGASLLEWRPLSAPGGSRAPRMMLRAIRILLLALALPALPALAQDDREITEEARKQYAAALKDAATLVEGPRVRPRAGKARRAARDPAARAARALSQGCRRIRAGRRPTRRWSCSAR